MKIVFTSGFFVFAPKECYKRAEDFFIKIIMSAKKNPAEEYVRIILEDDREKIAGEETVLYREGEKIERLYRFPDGAVVRYQWQSFPAAGAKERYNHRFSLVTAPQPNPQKLKTGIIRSIDYSGNNAR